MDKYCIYNDDVQGTAGIVLAGMINAARIKGTKLSDEKYLFLGAGSAGIGLANLLCSAMAEEGLTLKQAQARVYMFDINGLLETTRKDLFDFQKSQTCVNARLCGRHRKHQADNHHRCQHGGWHLHERCGGDHGASQ